MSACRMALPAVLREKEEGQEGFVLTKKSSLYLKAARTPQHVGQAGWEVGTAAVRQGAGMPAGCHPSQEDQAAERLSCWAWAELCLHRWVGLVVWFCRTSPCCVDLHLMCPLLYCVRPPIHKKPQCHRFPGKGFFAPPFLDLSSFASGEPLTQKFLNIALVSKRDG